MLNKLQSELINLQINSEFNYDRMVRITLLKETIARIEDLAEFKAALKDTKYSNDLEYYNVKVLEAKEKIEANLKELGY